MRKMVLRLECGIGTDTAEFYLVPDEIDQEQLDDYAWEKALANADTYGIYPESDRPEEDEDDEDAPDSWTSDTYSDDIEGWWEVYDEEKHDGLRVGGGDHWEEY
jgi:hypothetical protein